MRTLLIRLFLSLFLLFPVGIVSAQEAADTADDTPQPFASGIGSTATYLDQRGSPIIELTVTNVERDWEGYGRYSEPQAGSDYVLIHFSVTNLGNRVFVLEPSDFELVDSLGVAERRAWISNGGSLLTENTSIDGGETLEAALVFEVFSDLDPLMLFYSPESRVYVVIHLAE